MCTLPRCLQTPYNLSAITSARLQHTTWFDALHTRPSHTCRSPTLKHGYTCCSTLRSSAAHPAKRQTTCLYTSSHSNPHNRLGIDVSMFASHWFVTVLSYTLPPAHLVRVWDVFLLDGYKMIFRTAIALLKSAQDALLSLPFEGALMRLN